MAFDQNLKSLVGGRAFNKFISAALCWKYNQQAGPGSQISHFTEEWAEAGKGYRR